MRHGLHHVASTRFAFRPNHRCTFDNAPQGFAQILCTADERYIETGLVNVINIVCRRKHLALVDIIDLDSLQNLRLSKVADAALGHHRDGNGSLNTFDHLRIAHPRNTASCTNISRNALERHHCTRTRSLGNTSLFRSCHVHNHSALKHLSQVAVQCLSVFSHNDIYFLRY